MALPVKKKKDPVKPKKGATPGGGMAKGDDGKGKPKTVMNKGIGGLSDAQAKGGDEPNFHKTSAPRSKAKGTKQGMK
jgi:hypothetical protein